MWALDACQTKIKGFTQLSCACTVKFRTLTIVINTRPWELLLRLVTFPCLISSMKYAGLPSTYSSVAGIRAMLIAAFMSRFRSVRYLLAHFIQRWELRSKRRSPVSYSLCTASVRASQRWHMAVVRCSHMPATPPPALNTRLWRMNARCKAQYMTFMRTEGSFRCSPPFPHTMPLYMITGFFWRIPSTSTLSGARASARCSIQSGIRGTQCCPR